MGRSWPLPGAGAPRGAKETPPAAGTQGSTAEGLRWQTTHYTLTVPTRPLRPATHGHPHDSLSSLLPDVTNTRMAALTSKGRFRQISHWTRCPQILSPRRGSDTGSQDAEQPEGTHRLPPKRQEDHREDGFLPEALLPGDPGVDTAGAGPAPPTRPDSRCSLQRLPPCDDRTHPGHQARAMAQAQAEPRPGAVGGWRSVSLEVGQLSEEPRESPPRRPLVSSQCHCPGAGRPLCPECPGRLPAHHAVHHADVAGVAAQPGVHVPAEAVQAAEARGPPGGPAAVRDLQGRRLASGVQTRASPQHPTPPAQACSRAREPGSSACGQSCRPPHPRSLSAPRTASASRATAEETAWPGVPSGGTAGSVTIRGPRELPPTPRRHPGWTLSIGTSPLLTRLWNLEGR